MAQKHILIVCAEASGDLNAANLARKILELNPQIKISAVGGALLARAGAQIFYDIKGLAVIGFFDVLKKLPKFFSLKKLILEKIRAEKPDAVILVDFSGFNLRLAKAIGHKAMVWLPLAKAIGHKAMVWLPLAKAIKKSIPVFYYISPQVWASRPGRIKTIKEYIHKMLVIFKFEEEFYRRHGIDAEFTGHPLLDIAQPTMEKGQFLNKFGLCASKLTIALLPGSRKSEITHILPVMLKAACLVAKKIKDAQFVVAKSPNVEMNIYSDIIRHYHVHLSLNIVEDKTYDCLGMANFALVASGTATLETAIMQVPFAIIYKMNFLNYLLYRPQIKVPYIGMVNIVAGRKIIPEFVQFQANPQKIAAEAVRIITHPEEVERIKNELAQVKSLLGEKGASLRAAQIIIDSLNKQ